jgi:hypothetical protein
MPGVRMRSGVWLVVVACAMSPVTTLRAQTAGTDSTAAAALRALAPAGSNTAIAAGDSAYAPRYRFSPVFTNKITSDVSRVGMGNDFHVGLLTPWGSIFDFALSDDEANYRTQNRIERTKVMRLSDLHTFNPFWNGSTTYSDSRVFNRSVALGGGVQDFIIRRTFMGFRSDMMGSAGAIRSERTFKRDRNIQAGVNGGVAYDVGRRFTWQGRGALRGTNGDSTADTTTFTGLGSSEDSLVTGIRFQVADSIRFNANYKRYSGDRDFTDQARGSLGAQTSGSENVFKEHESRNTRNTTVSMSSRLFSRFMIDLSASHDDQVFDYAVQTTRFSRTVGDDLSGKINYTLPWKTVSIVSFDNTTTLRDLGPQSISSLTDKTKKVGLSLAHQFSKTLSLSMTASTQLQQSFYLKYAANPRDRDQMDTNVDVRLTSQPFKKIAATVGVGYSVSDFINIDASQSRDNRSRELWELRPGFTYTISPRFTIVQSYGLTIEYTDYDFQADQNFLDRNITFTNAFQYHPSKNIDLVFEYGFYLHDTGSYLPDPVTGERLLDVSSKDRRDRTRIRVDYRATKHITFFGENQYSNRQDLSPDNELLSESKDGQILVGSSGLYDWGSGRTLRFSVARVKRFSPFGAEAEKNYWDARSELAYPF